MANIWKVLARTVDGNAGRTVPKAAGTVQPKLPRSLAVHVLARHA